MHQLNNPLEVYKLLPKSNCKQCELPTCLAFADAVIKGQKGLDNCPHIEGHIVESLNIKVIKRVSYEQQTDHILEQLKNQMATIDFYSSAERLGDSFTEGKLKIKCLGKDFTIDSSGSITSDCHVIPWLTIPLIDYIVTCSGKDVTGHWVPFRELKNGMTWIPLFEPLCEKPLKQIADTYTDLFEMLLHVFGGKHRTNRYSSDISLVLYPLPRVPILICYCYCRPEDELDSKLNIFFDTTAEDNLNIRSVFGITSAIVRMFEKITLRHG
ncbi:MAG: DUF3786 domain-containing protein [Bacillota bacterium]